MKARNAVLWVALSVTFSQPGWGQTANESLRFEVASIKARVDVGTQRAGVEETPNLVRLENLPLSGIIGSAYGVPDFQLIAPDSDRFKLQVHREKRLVTGYALRVAAGGHKLPPATGERGFFTALREQMGLRLEPWKVTIDVVVVDRVERAPTEN